mgnify:CR=1 FL=1
MSVSISKTVTGGDESSELVQLHICVQDEDWRGTFDRIEVERSRGSSTGPFEPLTADLWASARVPEGGGDEPITPAISAQYDVVGLELLLRVNEQDEYTVTFTDPGPGTLTLHEAADQIEVALPQVVKSWVDEDSQLVIETFEPGTGAALRVVGGDAAPKLGLPTTEPSSLAYGRAAKITLQEGKERYTFTDVRGSTTYYYRTRFYGSTGNVASEYSQPQPSTQSLGISADGLVCGQVRLARLDGRPLCGANVRVYGQNALHEVKGFMVSGPQLQVTTDTDGVASFTLIKGSSVTVAIDGTSLVRDIVVPEDADEGVFNLLDPSIGPDDYYRVRHPDIEYAQKRTL